MATTTNYGWSTPDDTALVSQGAAAIRTLGSSADTTVKALSPGTTAGDVDYYTSSTAKARLGIGTTGQVLSVSGGVPAWANPAGGFNPILTPQNSGEYVNGMIMGTTSTGVTPVEDRTYYRPFFLSGIAFDRMTIRTGAAFSGTSSVRLGIYNASQTTGKPTTVFLDAGTISCTAASTTYELTISSTPPAGYYYLAFNMQTSPTSAEFLGYNTELNPTYMNTATGTTTALSRGYYQSSVTGAFATAGTLVANTANNMLIALRIV